MTGTVSDDELERLVGGRHPAALADPFPVWSRLRTSSPVHRIGTRILMTRHPDVKALCQDASQRYAFSYGESAFAQQQAAALPPDQAEAFRGFWRFEATLMPSRVGDDHARLRRIAHTAFTPRRVAELRGSMGRYVDELLGPVGGGDVVDVMQLAYRLPLKVVIDLLGCPQDDMETIRAWSHAIGMCFADAVAPEVVVTGHRAVEELKAYVRARARAGAHHDATDLMSVLLDARSSERLDEDELAAMFVLFLFAGHETTTNLIGHGLHQLLVHRDQWRLLCAEPARWPAAVDELLRFVSPVQYVARPAAEPHVFAGVQVERGDTLYPVLAAANRDPAVFAAPDTLDVTRANARAHLAFGSGTKYCLGAALARLEGAVVLGELARRFPAAELATSRLQYTGNAVLRRLAALPVALR